MSSLDFCIQSFSEMRARPEMQVKGYLNRFRRSAIAPATRRVPLDHHLAVREKN
ncbi:hypothetical protein [Pseudomonas sp. NA-150]|uniref:hypothetical protein n=1 Tax=Pseudomonas sp. NA-150 TaxID=3367525 RepID=UPI0037C69731